MNFHEREDDLESELNRGALWAVTYGDMMSYLMIFFMVAFALPRNVSNAAPADSGGPFAGTMDALFRPDGIQRIARIEVSPARIRISFNEPALFAPGSARLKPSSLVHLKKLAVLFRKLPNPVQIEGHTDDRPMGRHAKFGSNWELSAARAFSVLRFLLGEGVPPEKLSAAGYGEFKPLRSNGTPEGRAANRRIEFNIIRHEISEPGNRPDKDVSAMSSGSFPEKL